MNLWRAFSASVSVYELQLRCTNNMRILLPLTIFPPFPPFLATTTGPQKVGNTENSFSVAGCTRFPCRLWLFFWGVLLTRPKLFAAAVVRLKAGFKLLPPISVRLLTLVRSLGVAVLNLFCKPFINLTLFGCRSAAGM